MSRVRWAVNGAGGIARRRTIPEGILPAENAELAIVYSPNSGHEVAEQFGVEAASSEDSLYETDWDAVYVASPVDCHKDQVIRAARSGRHVLCEKPLALNVAEAAQMIDACHSAGVQLGVGFMMRNHPLHQQMAELIAQNAIGKPTYVRAQLSCWYPPIDGAWRQDPSRSGGGPLPDLATHCIDLLETVLSQRVAIVSCMIGNLVHDYPSEDTSTILVQFSGGTVGTIDCLFNLPDLAVPNRLEVYGSAGSILAEGTIGQTTAGEMKWYGESTADCYDPNQRRPENAGWTTVEVPRDNLYRNMIEGFSAAVLSNQSPPVSGDQGLWIQRVLKACYDSAEQGAHISLSPTKT